MKLLLFIDTTKSPNEVLGIEDSPTELQINVAFNRLYDKIALFKIKLEGADEALKKLNNAKAVLLA